jgi:hypothetical protein
MSTKEHNRNGRVSGAGTRAPAWPRSIAAALTIGCALFSPVSSAAAIQADHGELRVGTSPAHPGAIVMSWQGKIAAPMAKQIKDAFDQRKWAATRVVLQLSSGGGIVADGERVIEVLQDIKKTHQLQTVVNHGQMCGSMCVFIFAQGDKRTAALSSTWLFHEVSKMDPATKRVTGIDRPRWERLVDLYLRPAGVSAEWIANMKPYTVRSDYWQTGADLVNEKSGLIHEPLGNQQARIIHDEPGAEPAPPPAPPRSIGRGDTPPAGTRTGECRKYIATIGAVVTVQCP